MNSNKTPNATVFWILWAALINGMFIIIFALNGGFPKGQNVGEPATLIVGICTVAVVIAMGIRFLVIPKIQSITQLLPAMLIGLALCEGVGIISIVAVPKTLPQTQLALITAAISTMLVYAPVYVSRKNEKL
jgi:hypothetical protein